jgi:hypothetical protein
MVRKLLTQEFDVKRFYLKKLNDAEVEEWYGVKMSNRCAALENLDGNMNINNLEVGKENVKIAAGEKLKTA